MSWTAPMTWIPDTVLTSAQLNTQIRDNLLETAPAKSVGSFTGGYFVTESPHVIGRRFFVNNRQVPRRKIRSSSWSDLDHETSPSIGAIVKCYTGAAALVFLHGAAYKDSVQGPQPPEYNDTLFMGLEIRGATDVDPDEKRCWKVSEYADTFHGSTYIQLVQGLTPGIHTFKAVYKVSGACVGNFQERYITVMPL